MSTLDVSEVCVYHLNVEVLVTVEDEHEAAELVAQRLHRFSLASSRWTC